ncbi:MULTISPECIES: HupE/UreJ family protein [Marinomonas]|uniref:HupE/UreJ family protein n=1 Tax=Marinomonas rhodophyticola TaxID=2992803 RepID=A0ABT3KL37_9GAMM|nr:HupE/UreJ family protein [Marinomonas sp. KJ51-3]MCW4631287.1 HupE/UreJ family protein [Marinomonas sp. KJ51-3]
MRLSLKMALAALVAAIPALASAHPGHEHTTSFMTGFMHPMGGLDHLLAMLAIGLWAASLGGRALWAIPAAFVGTMLVGGGLAVAGVQVPFIEQGIVLSVILMGALLVGAARFPIAVCAGIAGLFALFHGAAHGLEMPLNANGAEYALGFAAATALLHIVGIGFAIIMARFQAPILTRIMGSLIAVAGVFLALV